MTSRELVVKTLNHEPVPRVPRDLWFPSEGDAPRPSEIAELNVRYPSDIVQPEMPASHPKKSHGKHAKAAAHDAHADLLDRSRFAKVNKSCDATSRFVLAWSEARPFDRLRAARGDETALVELARGGKEIRDLLALTHETACKELELWADTNVDGVALRDDWGADDGLLIAPEMWRELFRPLYKDYCKILHAKDKFVFFRSGGNIHDIFSDLIKAGIDAIHCDLQVMDIERLAKRYRGRVTLWGGMDHRRLAEPSTPDEFREAVLSVRRAFDFGSGGAIAQCFWEPGVRIQTIASFFEHWLTPLPMHQ
jgi:uroporphyrinogen decarboxylase